MGKYSNIEAAYKQMYKIRRFEETLLQLFSENKLKGTTHTSIGQEADAVAVMNQVSEKDYIFSNHRCHGQFIAYSDDIKILLSEIMAKKSGMCGGRGGSQHICYKHFFTNGVQGGIVPNAVGLALSQRMKNDDGVTVVFLGDGTLGQGIVYESFNMASLYNAPILFIIEDNGYAMSTKNTDAVAGSMVQRAEAFGIKTSEIKSNDVELLDNELKEAFRYVREDRKPYCQVIHTYRLGPHSKGDDTRDQREIDEWKKLDPLCIVESRLIDDVIRRTKDEVCNEIEDAISYAESMGLDSDNNIYNERIVVKEAWESLLSNSNERVLNSLNTGLYRALSDYDEVLLFGEDICDPYGGAFKVTKGLSTFKNNKVFNTPISEAGFIGLCVGLAMGGMKPIVEVMFGDFISLGFDQILNHATKYEWMYNGQIKVPMLIRVPSGGGRGYGPTHSQSLEKYLIGIPNLRVIATNRLLDSRKLLERIIGGLNSPTILVENKKMYGLRQYEIKDGHFDMFKVRETKTEYPVINLSLREDISPDAVILTYGGMVDLAIEAAKQLLIEQEILVNIIIETSISPIDYDHTVDFIGDTNNIVTLEEGNLRAGWGSEVLAGLTEQLEGRTYKRIAAKDCVIPCGYELEEQVLPKVTDIVEVIRGMA